MARQGTFGIAVRATGMKCSEMNWTVSRYNRRTTKKAPEKKFSPGLSVWRPLGDLNPRRRRERAVSWAGLDEGDVVSRVGVEPTTT